MDVGNLNNVKHCVVRAQTPMSINFEHHAIHNNWYKSLVNSGVWSMPINESGLNMFLDIPSCRGDQEESSSKKKCKTMTRDMAARAIMSQR